MATKVTMPQMGFDMTEGKVARWLKIVIGVLTLAAFVKALHDFLQRYG